MKVDNFSLCLFDIEGTTTPISFVHDKLFPYSRDKMEAFILTHQLEPHLIAELIEENKKDFAEGLFSGPILGLDHIVNLQILVSYLQYLIRVDRKSKPLKEIQGKIWKTGYEKGELTSELFADVIPFFKKLQEKKIPISIYSSGSVEAQKYIFQYSNYGNLTKYISYYFDTNIGNKRDSRSYVEIARQIGINPNRILFFTDIKEEADASTQVGASAMILDRPGNHPQANHNYPVITDFYEMI